MRNPAYCRHDFDVFKTYWPEWKIIQYYCPMCGSYIGMQWNLIDGKFRHDWTNGITDSGTYRKVSRLAA